MRDCQLRYSERSRKALWIVCPFVFNGVSFPRGYIVFFNDGKRQAVKFEEFDRLFYSVAALDS